MATKEQKEAELLVLHEKYGTLAETFREKACKKWRELSGGENQDWFSLSLGWAVAKGLDPDQAYKFSLYVRYDLKYFNEVGDVFDEEG